MNEREVIQTVLDGGCPPYVPWHCGFTAEPLSRLAAHLGTQDWNTAIGNHFVKLGHSTGFVEPLGNGRYRDPFGVVWNRRVERDIGTVEGLVLPEPTLSGFSLPDPEDDLYFRDIPEKLGRYSHCFRVYCIGFSLFERAWTLRGMDNVLMDFYEHPQFLHELLDAIADYNLARVQRALSYDIDAVYYGDDWGQQSGLIMGPKLWSQFLRPRLARMFRVVKDAGKYLVIHSCGDIRLLLDDLVELGVDLINPFQPEAMDVPSLLREYRGRAAFHGGLSTQQTLSRGTAEEVRVETRRLLELGSQGGYIFAPAHAVEGDTPLENMLAFLEEIQGQVGYDGDARCR
jgi:uroporphyrinogen decarboxylase